MEEREVLFRENSLTSVMLIANDTENVVEAGRRDRTDGRIGCEGFAAPRRQARPYRDVLVVKWCGLPLPNPALPHVCLSPPTPMLRLMLAVLLSSYSLIHFTHSYTYHWEGGNTPVKVLMSQTVTSPHILQVMDPHVVPFKLVGEIVFMRKGEKI